jgi:hypothetical protein
LEITDEAAKTVHALFPVGGRVREARGEGEGEEEGNPEPEAELAR